MHAVHGALVPAWQASWRQQHLNHALLAPRLRQTVWRAYSTHQHQASLVAAHTLITVVPKHPKHPKHPASTPPAADVDQYAGQDSDFLRLQVWLRRQALMLAKGKLPEKRQAMLRKLGVRLKVDLALVKKYAQLQVGCRGGCCGVVWLVHRHAGELGGEERPACWQVLGVLCQRCPALLQGLVLVPQTRIQLAAAT